MRDKVVWSPCSKCFFGVFDVVAVEFIVVN